MLSGVGMTEGTIARRLSLIDIKASRAVTPILCPNSAAVAPSA
jgi:hypothetical protein